MQKIIKNLMPLCLMLSIPISNIVYCLLNNANRGSHSLVTDLDLGVPFLKIFVLPYLVWYFFIVGTLTYFCFKDKKIYYRTLIAINLGLWICYGIYFFFQTNVPRPDLIGNDFFTMLIAFIYDSDQPYNAFPSIHVLLSFIMIKAINKYPAKNYLNVSLVYITAILIILSTQFIKQHVILDLLSAIVLGGSIFDLVFNLNIEGLRTWLREPYLRLMKNLKSNQYLPRKKGGHLKNFGWYRQNNTTTSVNNKGGSDSFSSIRKNYHQYDG